MNVILEHRLAPGLIRARIALVLLCSIALSAIPANAQTPNSQQAPDSMAMGETHPVAPPAALQDLVAEAEKNNPELAASFHAWKAGTYAPKQASALPETELTVQQFAVGSPRPFAGFSNSDFAYIGFGASQELPYPGKRSLRSQVAEREADSLHEQTDSVRRQVIENLKQVYFHLAYIQQTLSILQRNDQLLNQVQEVAENRYRVGQGNQQDVLKAQLQHTKILQEIAHHHQEEGQLEAQLKQILNRAQESPDIVTENLVATPLRYSAADLLQKTRENNPDVRAHAAMVRGQETRVELAHKEFRPDFSVGYMYEHNASQFPDYYMATFSVRLPNRGRQSAALAEALENQERSKQELQSEVQRTLSEVQQQYVFVKQSEERLKIYEQGLVPQSNATFQAGLAAYQSNRQDFESLISSFLDVLNLDLEYRSELAEHESALAKLERLTGVTLP